MREEDGRETFAAYELKLLKKKKRGKQEKKKNSIAYVPQQRHSEEKKNCRVGAKKVTGVEHSSSLESGHGRLLAASHLCPFLQADTYRIKRR